jgi:hypothetical protein
MGHLSLGNDNINATERAIFLQYLNLAHFELYQGTASLNQALYDFEEIDKAQLASSKLSETVSSQMGTQAKMLDLFNVALTRYTDNIERLMQIESSGIPPMMGGPGGPTGGNPIGGGPYIVPSSGGGGAARTPEQVLAQAGYVNTMFITGKDETGKGIRRNLVEQTEMGPMGGVTFSHGLANEITQNIMGSRSIVPGIFTNTSGGSNFKIPKCSAMLVSSSK